MSSISPLSELDKKIKLRQRQAALKSGYISLGMRVAAIALAVLLLLSCMFMMTQAKGTEMFPAVKDGDLVIGFRLQRKYSVNDVVVYDYEGKRRIGRIVSCGGDIIDIGESGTVYVNGTLKEGEIMFPSYPDSVKIIYPMTVPDGEYFIMGDYRTMSEDSRSFGTVPAKNIKSKAISILRRRML